MIGGALGGVESMFFPNEGVGFWPLISMGAVLGGTMRVPFTSVIFVLELTRDFNAFLPLFVREVMRTNIVAISKYTSIDDLSRKVESARGTQHLYPVIGSSGEL